MANKKDVHFVEQVWFVYGLKIGRYYIGFLDYQNDGEVCEVRFDFAKAFFGKKGTKRHDKWLLGFYHSHPGGDPYPSSTDDNTMDAWVKAKGKELICGIFSGGKQNCFLYDRLKPKSSDTGYGVSESWVFGNKKFLIAKGRRKR